jgi:hypothetical protein
MIGTREVFGRNPELPTWLGLSQPQLAYFIIFLPTHYFSFLIIFSTHPPKRMLPFSLFSFRSHFPTPSLSLLLSLSPSLSPSLSLRPASTSVAHPLSHSGHRRRRRVLLSLAPAKTLSLHAFRSAKVPSPAPTNRSFFNLIL